MNIINTSDPKVVAEFIAKKIISKLEAGRRVLWLVPGGSSIVATAIAAKIISSHPHENLTVMPGDERFGPVGHTDSNWFQMEKEGFSLPGARLVPLLTGDDRETTTKKYAENLKKYIAEADYVLGFFGVGADGHTAGMLPGTPPLRSSEFAASYQAAQYERVTVTPLVIDELDEVVAFAVGENKCPILKNLKQEVPIEDNPVQLLKRVPEFTLFTDCAIS
ncbi:MAG: 6-phosphogluconolactonase [Patescibacteria group bacterium]